MALTKVGKEGITGISNASDATAITITSGELVGIGMTPVANYGLLQVGSVVTSALGVGGLQAYVAAANSALGQNGNVSIVTTDGQAANIGGSIGLGGKYVAAGTSAIFAHIAGRKENGTDNNSAGYLQFATQTHGGVPTEKMRIASDGKVGIGTTSPAHNLEIVSTASGSVNDTLQIRNNATASGTGSRIRFINSTDATSDTNGASIASVRTGDDNDLRFETENAERMRILAAGDVEIGDFVTDGSATGVLFGVGGGASAPEIQSSAQGTNDRFHYEFYNNNGKVGGIKTNGSSTSYNTSSDYRLKESVDYTWDATTRLKQLKPARFNFISDDTNTLVDGFIAHEVSSIVPEAISGAKDAMAVETRYTADDVETQGDTPSKNVGDPKTYSSSKIDSQGIDQSKLVPLLVKTIQELEARITALEA